MVGEADRLQLSTVGNQSRQLSVPLRRKGYFTALFVLSVIATA